MQQKLTVFVSAVTADFGALRDQIASRLRAKGHEVKVQSDFRQEDFSDTTLSKLQGYIARCDRVIALVGGQSGSFPPAAAAQPFDHLRPAEFPQVSLTQWEVVFALAANPKALFLYDGRACPVERAATGGDADQQAAWVDHLTETLGLDRTPFATPEQAIIGVLELDWPDLSRARPNNLPFGSRNHLFIGRDQALQDLRTNLLSGAPTAVTAQALHAMGGVGKTQLAVEYALRNAGSYSALLFLSARVNGTEDAGHSLRNALALLAEANALDLPNRQQVDEAARSVLGWLRQTEDWLLIIDNVDTAASAKAVEALLGQLGKGHVLITARYGNWTGAVRTMPLGNLSPEHATQLLLDTTTGKRRAQPDDATVAALIAQDLGHLALALQQAAAYVSRKRITFADYRARLTENRAKVLEWFNKDALNYPEPVATTWTVTVAELSDAARDLLNMLSLYAPDPIPVSLLAPLGEKGEEALAELADYALIEHDSDTPTFTVHPLLQEVTRWRLGEGLDERMDSALGALLLAVDGQDPQDVRTWPTYLPLYPHATALMGRVDATDTRKGLSSLLNQLGLLAMQRADWSQAEATSRRALAIDEEKHGLDHPNVANRLNNLAGVLQATNRLPEAETLFRRALAVAEASHGPNDPVVAIRLNNLAGVLRTTNHLLEAEPMYRRSLSIMEARFGPDHPSVATCLNNLAAVLQDTNRLPEAEAMYRRAMTIAETSYGPDHPSVAVCLNNLAGVLQDTNRLLEAEPIYRRALVIAEASYGPDHPFVAVSLNNLARALQGSNRIPEAEAMCRRALAIDEASYGPDHPEVASRLNNLGAVLQASNRFPDAEAMYRRALAIDEASYGPDHPEVATRLNNLAGVLRATNRLLEAETMFRRSLAILLTFGHLTQHEHPNFKGALQNWAVAYQELGNTEAQTQATLEAILAEVAAKAAAR